MGTIEAIEHELNVLEAERKQQEIDREKLLRKSANTDLSKQEFSLLSGFEALKEIYQRRKAKLEADKKAAQAELDFQRYEEMTKGQFDHYTQIVAMDEELEAIQQRRSELIAQRSEMEANNQVAKFQRIHLGLDLDRINRERIREINNRYQVPPHM